VAKRFELICFTKFSDEPWNVLELTCDLVLSHPKYLKAIKGKKT